MNKEGLETILNNLSIDEKVGQLIQLSGEFFSGDELSIGPASKLGIDDEKISYVGSILNVSGAEQTLKIQKKYLENSRHKIPVLFMNDVIYAYKTALPSPLGLGATWNPKLIEKSFNMIAREASSAGIHVTFSPMADLVRDPRWGRVAESTGEDTFLSSQMIKAMVRGFQNNFEANNSLVSCVKHFAGYGAAEGGRDYNTVDLSKWRLFQEHFPIYKSAIDAGAKMVMTSFNTIEGIPSTGNEWLVKDVLRKQWGFNGAVIADYAAVAELVYHGVAKDFSDAAALAMNASVDIDMKSPSYINHLKKLVESGVVSHELLDAAVMRVLELKNALGLFEDPFRNVSVDTEKRNTLTKENLSISKEVSDESIVLLENNGVLPLKKDKKIALVGPYADAKDIVGMWAINTDFKSVVTLKTSLEKEVPNLVYSKGTESVLDLKSFGKLAALLRVNEKEINNPDHLVKLLSTAKEAMEYGDVIVLTLGEHMLASGEGGSRQHLDLPQHHIDLFNVARTYNKPIVSIIYGGRPLLLDEISKYSDAVIFAGFPGTSGGASLTDILVGKVNPSGKITMSFPRNVGQIPVYYNHFSTGRPMGKSSHSERFVSRYIDGPNDPQYPFGYGLSYHDVKISNLKLNKQIMKLNESLEVSLTLTNVTNIKGKSTLQWYIHDHFGSVVRPVRQLVGFDKIEMKEKEVRDYTFRITQRDLVFYNSNLDLVLEPGEFTLFVGFDSDCKNSMKFTVEG